MGEMKPTPGVWKWDSDPIKGDPFGRVHYRVVTIGKTITQCYYSSSDEHAESDARLIAEAGTVFHNTGLSPVQLVEMVRELKELLGHVQAAAIDQRGADFNLSPDWWAKFHAALAKCEGVKACQSA